MHFVRNILKSRISFMRPSPREYSCSRFAAQIHHRQTLLLLMDGNADAGPVWISEALYQKRIGSPLDYVPIPEEQNESGTYFIAIVERTARHRVVAAAFLDFMRRKQAQGIYAGYGFSSAN